MYCIFGHTFLLFCIRHLVIRRHMIQYVDLKLREDGIKPQRTVNKAILLSECSRMILDISKATMIPLDLWETKIHNLKATLRLIFYRKLFKYLKLTKTEFLGQFINFWKHNDYLIIYEVIPSIGNRTVSTLCTKLWKVYILQRQHELLCIIHYRCKNQMLLS